MNMKKLMTLACATLALFTAGTSLAADRWWDGGTTNIAANGDGASQGGSGTWNTSTNNWDQGGAQPHIAWVNGSDTAIFGGTAGTVTLGEGITVGGLTFTAAYTLTNNTVTFGAAGIITNSAAVTIASAIAGTGPITKDGAGALTLSGTSSYTGGTVINAGTVSIRADSNLGAANSTITFNGNAALNLTATVDSGSRPITVNNGAIATISTASQFLNFTTRGAVTGSGGIAASYLSGNASYGCIFSLLAAGDGITTGNTFTGPITVGNNMGVALTMNSLADSANPIVLNSQLWWDGSVKAGFTYGAGATTSLTLNNRQFQLGSAANGLTSDYIVNASSYALTINTDLGFSGTGARTLSLGAATGTSRFAGRLTDNTGGALSLGIYGPWRLSGTNTYSGATTLNTTLTIQGMQALSPNSAFTANAGGALTLLDDGSGTISSLANLTIVYNNVWGGSTIFVGNNNTANGGTSSGTTTGSTLAIGNLTFSGNGSYDYLNILGANQYRLSINNVTMRNASAGNQSAQFQFIPTTAPITIAGTIIQTNGNANSAYINTLVLDGTATGNLISGTIKDAADYTNLSNANARPLKLTKSSTSTWTLSGTNTYSGATTISAGKLFINGSTSTGAVSVTAGSLGGTGTVNGAVTVSGTGGLDLRDGALGTLTINNNLAISGAAGANPLYFDIGAGGSGADKLMVTGNVTMASSGAGVVTLNLLSGAMLGSGTNDLIEVTGTLPAASSFTLATTAAFGSTFSLQNDGTGKKLQLVIVASGVAGPAATAWAGTVNANWSNAGNWTNGVPGIQSDATFYKTGAANLSTTLDADFDINSLVFNAGAISAVTVGGTKMLTLEATNGVGLTVSTPSSGTPTHTISARVGLGTNQTWTVNSGGSLTVSGVISDFGLGRSLTKGGAGTLTLSGVNTYSGGIVISGGTVIAGTLTALGLNDTVTFVGNSSLYSWYGGFPVYANSVQVNEGVTASLNPGQNQYYGMSFTGPLTGSGTLSMTPANAANTPPSYGFLNANNTFTGTMVLNGSAGNSFAQILRVNSLADSANPIRITKATLELGTGVASPLVFNSRQIDLMGTTDGAVINNNNATATITINTALLVSAAGNKTLTLGGSNVGDNTFAGAITNGSSAVISLVKADGGTWVLSGNNSYSGGTTVSAGTLKASAANALGAGNVTVSAGKLQIDAANAMADTAVLRLPSASAVNLVMNANDTVGALYINGVQQPNGTYTSSGAGSGWMSGSGTLMVGAASVQPMYWDRNGSTAGAGGATPSGTWDTSSYWNDAAGTGTAASWSAGRTAAFAAGTDATGSYTVTVSGSQDIGGLTFEEGDVTLSGGTELRLMSDAVAYVAPSRTATVATPLTQDVSGRALTKGGPGTLVLSADNTYSGATTLNTGTLRLAATNAIASSARLSMAGGVAVVETNVNLTALTVETIAGNTATISGGTLAFALGGSITNKVDAGYGDTQPVLTISSAITGSPTVWAAAGTGGGPSYNYMKFAPTSGSQTLGKVSLGYNDGNGGDKGWIWLSGTTTGNSVSEVVDLGGYSFVKQDSGTWAYGNVPVSSLYLLGGNMILNGTVRTWYAGFILSGGTLHYNNPGAVNTVSKSLTINGGNIDNSSGSAITATNNPTMTWGGNFGFIGSNGTSSDLNLGIGAVTMTTSPIVTVSNALTTLTVGGVISGAGFGLTKAGAGTLKLTGKNTYSGATTISNGTLQVVVGGSCSNSAVTVAGSTGTLAISVTNTVPKWTCSNLTLDSGNLKFSFSVAPSFTDAPLSITNTVALTGSPTVVVDPVNLQPGKKYPLLTVGGTPPVNVPALSLTGMSGTLGWEGNTLYLNIAAAGTKIIFW